MRYGDTETSVDLQYSIAFSQKSLNVINVLKEVIGLDLTNAIRGQVLQDIEDISNDVNCSVIRDVDPNRCWQEFAITATHIKSDWLVVAQSPLDINLRPVHRLSL